MPFVTNQKQLQLFFKTMKQAVKSNVFRYLSLALGLLLVAITAVFSHEFWLLPEQFFLSVDQNVKVSVEVGEDFTGERWGGGTRRVTALKLHTQTTIKDLTSTVQQDDSGVIAPVLKLEETGTQLLTLATNNSFIELEPEKFLAYLTEDGLGNAIAYRQKHNETTKKGRELYRRCAKTVLQVGASYNDLPTKNTGMTLEIIPAKNPYQLVKNQPLTCQFLYEQKPLKNYLVRCWRRINGKTEVEFKKTNVQGNATFELVNKGEGNYMVSTVQMVRLANDPKADWQSTWGSLTFGRQ
ncbi:MAG: DUF4198 domain-containing protein [Cytophagia bacterium]|nr:MAG: DUF4198 domain-containing protein [Runella sp.]TAG18168.1 MAG: DUF4198 domain-containing protein [Cytophagales bacterium]TAG37702.1 MAG: DUF4198 domain-containing protein [Cytophagia bacterium]TAG75417.1 MAG: DUF4198 domain-containing protein [Runella slithyformis]TAG78870.1 MAG: DUF4198 domain-containing protein [Cytophagales bacterium]